MSLRGRAVEETATLPDGRAATVRVALAVDPYLPQREIETVVLELRVEGELEAAINTVLAPEQDGEALELAREAVGGLASGTLEPTAAALEPLADRLR